MKKVLVSVLLFGSLLAAEQCSKCELNKQQLKCDYYVGKNGDTSKQDICLEYARYIDSASSHGKASWYYLMGGDLDNAVKAGENALKNGEFFAAEYIADAYVLKKEFKNAKKYYKVFRENISNHDYFIEGNFDILEKIYKDFDQKRAKELFLESKN